MFRSCRGRGCWEPWPGPSAAGDCSIGTAPRVDPRQAPVTSPPLDLAAEIAPIPVAIVHGRRDRYVPVSDAYALYERLGEPRRLVVLPRFGHGEAGFTDEFAVMLEALIADLLRCT